MDTKTILSDLRAERDRITNAIAALEALGGTAVSTQPARKSPHAAAPGTTPTAKTRFISPEGRKRIAEAVKKRWAKKKRAAKAATKKVEAPTPIAQKAQKPMSAATKRKLSAAAKERWAAKKTAASKTP